MASYTISAGGSSGISLIEQITLASPAASLSFSGIVNTYSHLYLTGMVRCSNDSYSELLYFRFNDDSGTNYDSSRVSFANASSFSNNEQTIANVSSFLIAGQIAGAFATANHFSPMQCVIPAYAGNLFKYVLSSSCNIPLSNDVNRGTQAFGMWKNTNAITKITILPSFGNLVTGTTISLYGLS